MSTLQNCRPELKRYLLKHQLPDVFEALFSALAVNQPSDGKEFMLEKIMLLKNDPVLLDGLQWDTFIDEDKRPADRLHNLDFMWFDDGTHPTAEMLEKAYSHYNDKLLGMCFYALQYYLKSRKEKRRILLEKCNYAIDFHNTILNQKYFTAWHKWFKRERIRQLLFITAVRTVYEHSLCREVFKAWKKLSADAKHTREYFEKIERGEVTELSPDGGEIKDHISLLPKQLAVNIFRFVNLPDLVNCSKVCRLWKEITQVSMLWSRIDLANADKGLISSKAITSLIQKCRPFLCHLNIRSCNFLHAKALKSIGDCRNLQDLNISSCHSVTDEVIQDITAGCSVLLYMNMARTAVTDASVRSLSRNCNSLQFLNISHCLNITNRGLHYLANGKGSQKLIYLDMSGCEQITRDGYKYLAKGCFRLNTVLLNELPSLVDECLEALTSECKHIRLISILHSPLITDAGMKYLCSSRKLQTLKIEGNNRYTDASMKTLIKSSPELRFLYFVDIHRITDMSLKALGQAKYLQVLNVADCVRISDAGVRYLVEGLSGSKIRELNLTNCIRVSDVSLLRISQRCSSLAYANFSYCEHITDAGIELLANIESLISIDLSGCTITDAGLVPLGNNSNFKDIIVSECSSITDIGVQKLVPNIDQLETFDLSHVHLITDQAIKNLAFSCRRLRVLNISGCVLITDQGIQYLCGVCHFIEKFDVSGCRLITVCKKCLSLKFASQFASFSPWMKCYCNTDRSLRYIRKGCHNLKILNMLYCRSVTKHGILKLRGKYGVKVTHSQDDAVTQLGNRSKQS